MSSSITCIDRAVMPQVDGADIPDLLSFLGARGIDHTLEVIDPATLRAHQHVVIGKVRSLVRAAYDICDKPCLVSADDYVVDGNHRMAAARVANSKLAVYRFSCDFDRLLPEIFAFPKTYSYGDGNDHSIIKN
jgi:hypothetical protein